MWGKSDQSDKAHERLFFIYFYPPWFYCTWVTPMPIFYSSSSSFKKKKKVGSNVTIELLHRTLEKWQREKGAFPPTLYLQLDNTVK